MSGTVKHAAMHRSEKRNKKKQKETAGGSTRVWCGPTIVVASIDSMTFETADPKGQSEPRAGIDLGNGLSCDESGWPITRLVVGPLGGHERLPPLQV